MQSSREQQGEIRKPSEVNSAKKQKKTVEWERAGGEGGGRMRRLDGTTGFGHQFDQARGDGEGPGSPVCCSPWGHREQHTTYRLNHHHKMKLTKND